MINFGPVPIGSVLPIPFATYAASGGSITLTGLAVTDIEVYKGTSMTQRASDAGYALMDTDGIDLDGLTGIHGFSVDTGNNTDAGFFAAGSFYFVAVSAVTVDSQTVSFIAATFRLIAAENTAGVPVADAVRVGGTAQTGADLAARLPAALVGGRIDASVGAMAANVMTAAAAASDLTTELQAGLATSAALATLQATASAIDGKTTNLPTDPADHSVIIAATDAVMSRLGAPAAASIAADIAGISGGGGGLDAAGVRAAIGLAAANLDTQLGSIKSKTDSLTFTQAGHVDANVQRINDVIITGNGAPGTLFGV